MAEVRRLRLRDIMDDPEKYKAELGQPLVDILLDHKSAWVPDSKGGEPNHR